MHPARLLLLLGVTAYLADPGEPLHVLRATPSGEAGPGTVITISFDRPVAGSLDETRKPLEQPPAAEVEVVAHVGALSLSFPLTGGRERVEPGQPGQPQARP